MKRFLLLLCLPFICFGQKWVDMMQDSNVNFYETQSTFNNFWENKEIEKGIYFLEIQTGDNIINKKIILK